MKQQPSMIRSGSVLLLAACGLLLNSFQSSASVLSQGVDLGASGPNQPGRNWAVFSLGGLDDDNTLSGTTDVIGDVGIALGDLKMSGNATIDGIGYLRTGGLFSHTGHSTVTGGVIQTASSDSILSQGASDAVSASDAAFALGSSIGYPTTIHANTSLTLSTTGDAVLKLTDFKLSTNAILTLNGPSTGSFVINVTKAFELTSGSSVQLTGGLTWDNVLFNVLNGGDLKLSGSSQLNGSILATDRTVSLGGSSKVIGEVIAKKVKLAGGSNVTRPPLVSP
jgi:hypothetical protein